MSELMQSVPANIRDVSYRLVYLQPNAYSDEALTVGVVVSSDSGISLRRIVSPSNFDALSCLYDEDVKEQTVFALEVLREYVGSTGFRLVDADSPVDTIRFGPVLKGSCEDIDSFSNDILRLSSSLYRSYKLSCVDNLSVRQKEVEKSLKEAIVRINPFLGKSLVETKKIKLNSDNYIEIPIFGEQTMGVPISLATKVIGEATKSAEMYMTRLNYVRSIFNRDPVIYVYVPRSDGVCDQKRVMDGVGELEILGKASDIKICSASEIDVLARSVYRYESLPVS